MLTKLLLSLAVIAVALNGALAKVKSVSPQMVSIFLLYLAHAKMKITSVNKGMEQLE